MKHLQRLALVVVASTTLFALYGAGSASAAKFTAGKVGAKLNESTLVNHVRTITGSKIECTEITFTGSTEGLETLSQSVVPSYSGCTAFGFTSTVTNIGCKFVFYASGQMDIAPTICEITFVVNNVFAKCKVIWRGQEIPGALSYTDNKGDVKTKFTVSGIDAEVTESSGLCPLTVGKHTNVTYTGESTFKAEGTSLGWDS